MYYPYNIRFDIHLIHTSFIYILINHKFNLTDRLIFVLFAFILFSFGKLNLWKRRVTEASLLYFTNFLLTCHKFVLIKIYEIKLCSIFNTIYNNYFEICLDFAHEYMLSVWSAIYLQYYGKHCRNMCVTVQINIS